MSDNLTSDEVSQLLTVDLGMVEFWKADVEDKLRRGSLIFDDGK